MPTVPPSRPVRGRRLSGAAVSAMAIALAVAGCQGGLVPSMTIGLEGSRPGEPLLKPDPRGGGDTFFALSLPPEPALPKHTVKVAGTPGNFSTPLRNETATVVANVIPNDTGFILEGTNLNKGSLTYYLNGKPMAVVKALPHMVVLSLPAGTTTAGSFLVHERVGANNVTVASAPRIDARGVYAYGRAVVRFKEGMPRQAIEGALAAVGAKYYRFAGMNFVVAYHSLDQTFNTVKTEYLKQAVFSDVSPDILYRTKALTVSDPRYNEQWGLPVVKAPYGWQFSAGSPDTIVAVLDTGVETGHPDLAQNIFKNPNEVPNNKIDDDGNGQIDDVTGWNSYDQTGDVTDEHGHGTQMAGIIAAASNTQGIVGVAFNSRVLPIKALSAMGVGTSSSLIEGINYAVRNRASVLNLSVASKTDDPAVKSAVEFAGTFNVMTVAAAGNDNNKIQEYPAAWSYALPLLAVGASNEKDLRASFSTWGEWLSVVAPGENILTTAKGKAYQSVSGTSAAAAYTSGLAALIKSLKPSYTPAMLKELIQTTAVDKGTKGFDLYYGHGRITLEGNLENLAGGMTTSSSSQHERMRTPPEHASDKNTETFWSSARRYQENPEWLTADLGAVRPITSIALLSVGYYSFLFPADFTLEVSQNGTSWTPVASAVDFEIPESTWRRWNIPAISGRYVRVNISKSRLNPDNQMFYDQIAEIAVNGEENAIVQTASSVYYGNYHPSWMTVDGDPNTMWISANRKKMQHEYVIADLGVSRTIASVDLLSTPPLLPDAFPKSFSLYVSNDKVNWTWLKDVKNVQVAPSTWTKVSVPQRTGRYLRVDVTDTNYVKSHGSIYGGFQLEGHTAAIAEITVNR